MPIFFQHQINATTRLAAWKIEEAEEFFKGNVPAHRDVTHPHKRLQHLAGRFLLQFLFPDFPYNLIQIADTRRPFLPDERYHFSISHCGDYAAAIVSSTKRVGIDAEIVRPLVGQLIPKFVSLAEKEWMSFDHPLEESTLIWCAKESVFKWYGEGGVDFRENIQLQKPDRENGIIACYFTKTNEVLKIHYRQFSQLTLAWIADDH